MFKLRLHRAEGADLIFQLNPGRFVLGRSPESQIPLDDPLISISHCELTVSSGGVMVRDLGSTNGTLLGGLPITQAEFLPGQVLQVGRCFLELESASGRVRPAAAAVIPRLSPKTSAGPPAADNASFLRMILSAVSYPLNETGLAILIGGAVFFTVIKFLLGAAGFLALPLAIALAGYLIAFLQRVITSSAEGDSTMPGWPDFSNFMQDGVQPFLLYLGTFLFCFGPAILVGVWGADVWEPLKIALICAGALYFPMALLAVAMSDSLASLNPVFIIASIWRTLSGYLVVCLTLALLVGVAIALEKTVALIPIPILPRLIVELIGLYFLMVETRILGLFYFTQRRRLKWL